MIVHAEFASRGGISLTITATYPGRPGPRRAMKRAVVLLSGGLDSATVLALGRAQGFGSYALSFRYGQRHEREIAAAEKIARSLGVREHRIAEIDLRVFGGSALTASGRIPRSFRCGNGAGNSGNVCSSPQHDFSFLRPRLGRSARRVRHFYWRERS